MGFVRVEEEKGKMITNRIHSFLEIFHKYSKINQRKRGLVLNTNFCSIWAAFLQLHRCGHCLWKLLCTKYWWNCFLPCPSSKPKAFSSEIQAFDVFCSLFELLCCYDSKRNILFNLEISIFHLFCLFCHYLFTVTFPYSWSLCSSQSEHRPIHPTYNFFVVSMKVKFIATFY